MPRQTHLSKDFFVNASEAEAKQHILTLPNWVANIKFVAEDPVRHIIRFVYERPTDEPENYNCIDVCLLPLNVDQTKITLHGSYIHGNVFYNQAQTANALLNFQLAIVAAINGSINQFELQQLEEEKKFKHMHIIAAATALAAIIYLLKWW